MEFTKVDSVGIGAFPKALAAIFMMQAAAQKMGRHELVNAVAAHLDQKTWAERVGMQPERGWERT